MADPTQTPPKTVTANLKLSGGGLAINAPMTVPVAPAPPTSALPSLQGLVDRAVEAGEAAEIAAGRSVTCRMGCAACCRHLVPLSRTEARALADVVAAQPEPRQSQTRAKMAAAAQRLRDANLVKDWFDFAGRAKRADRELSTGYFARWIDCPFLDGESCTIYAQRPLACRELKVTSPPENCSTVDQQGVEPVGVPKFSVAVRGMELDDPGSSLGHWMPLPLALEWAARLPPAKTLPGPDWVRRFLGRLSG